MRFGFHRNSGGRLLVAIAAVAIAGTTAVYALAGHQPSGVQSYTGCLIPSSGTPTKLAVGDSPSSPCNSGQVQIHLSGGDITAVTAGSGLTGGGANGAVSLGVNFAGTGSATTAARSDHNHDSQYLALTGKAADSDKLDGIDSTGFLGATAKAADADKLDGIDSTGFIQGAGVDFRKSSTLSGAANSEQFSTPYGTIDLNCQNAARYSFRRFAGSGGGQTIRVFDQTNGGAPQYYTIGLGFAGAVYQPTTPFRSTWEMIDNDGTSSLEVDIWVSFISQNRCDYVTHWSYAPNPS
jgi:hypothetical protein